MKFPFFVSGEENIFNFLETSVFKTPEFKSSLRDELGMVNEICRKFAEIPRIFAEMSEPNIESSHFYSWMNIITMRKYDNPVISDIYYLHEIYHAAYMEYNPEEDQHWNRWYTSMAKNELDASLYSEVFVYGEFGRYFRERAFDFDIWADRFDLSEYTELSWNAKKYIESERIRAMRDPDPYDYLEMQIHNYAYQNIAWARIWKENYMWVQKNMHNLRENPTLENCIAYFHALMENATHNIPFYSEACEFAIIANENKKKYGNHLLARGK
jgi:hypothetical protein